MTSDNDKMAGEMIAEIITAMTIGYISEGHEPLDSANEARSVLASLLLSLGDPVSAGVAMKLLEYEFVIKREYKVAIKREDG